MTFRATASALLALSLLPAGAVAAPWGAPRTIARGPAAFSPAVAVGAPGVFGIAYSRVVHGRPRLEYRRGTAAGFRPVVIVERSGTRNDSAALTFAGRQAVVAWIRTTPTRRAVTIARVDPHGVVGGHGDLGGAPYQNLPRFPDPAQLMFNTRLTATVAHITTTGDFSTRVKLPRGATFDATVAVLPGGDRLALWSDRGRVYSARNPTGTDTFGAPVRLSDVPAFARSPQLVVTSTGYAVALWTQSGSVRSASLPPGTPRFDVSRQLADPGEGAKGLSAIATTAGDLLVTFASAPGDNPAGPLRALRFAPGRPSTQPTTVTLTPAGERTRGARLGVDTSAPWAAWTTAGTGRHRVRAARVAADGTPGGPAITPRTISGSDNTATSPPVIALSLRGRGLIAWTTHGGAVHASTRSGL